MKIGNGFQMLTIFAKCSILNIRQDSGYMPPINLFKVNDTNNPVIERLNQIMSKLLLLSKFLQLSSFQTQQLLQNCYIMFSTCRTFLNN